jgi:hypothetical protein
MLQEQQRTLIGHQRAGFVIVPEDYRSEVCLPRDKRCAIAITVDTSKDILKI